MLSHQQARRAYDRIGSLQDSQAFYEDKATDVMLAHGEFASAGNVFEFGCGTGRLAQRLFESHLPATATYRGIDVSPKMVGLARQRLAPYGRRAEVALTEGTAPTQEPAAHYDRFVSTYVFDLLSESDIRAVVAEAHRMLKPGGLLAVVSLGTGVGPISRALATVWSWLQAVAPALVGGCRPIDLLPFFPETDWGVRCHQCVVAFGVPSEIVVAEKR